MTAPATAPPALTLDNIRPVLERIVSFIDEGVIIAGVAGQVLYHNPSSIELLNLPGDNPIESLRDLNGFNLQQAIEEAGDSEADDHRISRFQLSLRWFSQSFENIAES